MEVCVKMATNLIDWNISQNVVFTSRKLLQIYNRKKGNQILLDNKPIFGFVWYPAINTSSLIFTLIQTNLSLFSNSYLRKGMWISQSSWLDFSNSHFDILSSQVNNRVGSGSHKSSLLSLFNNCRWADYNIKLHWLQTWFQLVQTTWVSM